MSRKEGPFLQVACLCNLVIEDKRGVLSLIRIIDTLEHRAVGPSPPEDMEPVTYPMKLVLMMKSGKARGRHELKIVPEMPSGLTDSTAGMSIHFEGEDKGNNVVTDLNYTFTQEGLYWFHVYLEDEHLTSIPFRVKYSRVVTGPSS